MRSGRMALLLLVGITPLLIAEENHLRYLPSDTRAVVTIYFSMLNEKDRASGKALFDELYRTHLVPELGKETSLPLDEVSRIVIAMPFAGSFNGVIVVRGKLNRKTFDDQMTRTARATSALRVEPMGKPAVPVYTRRPNEKALLELVPPLEKVPPAFRKLVAPSEVHLAAVDEETLVVSLSGKKQLERALRARESSRWRVVEELGSLLRKQNPHDVTAGVLLEDSLHPGIALVADDRTRESFQQFEHITLRILGGKEVQVLLEVLGKSTAEAEILEEKSKRVLEILRNLLPTLFPNKTKRDVMDALLQSFRITRKDRRISLVGKLPESEWRKLLAPVEKPSD